MLLHKIYAASELSIRPKTKIYKIIQTRNLEEEVPTKEDPEPTPNMCSQQNTSAKKTKLKL